MQLRHGGTVLLLSVVSICAYGQRAIEFHQGREVAAKQLLVRLQNPGPGTLSNLRQTLDADVTRPLGSVADLYLVHSRTKTVMQMMAALAGRTDIAYTEPDLIIHLNAVANDAHYPYQYGLRNTGQLAFGGTQSVAGADISADKAWDLTKGSTANVVAVIDTGVDYNHPDLAANMWSAPEPFAVVVGGSLVFCPGGSKGFNAITGTCDPRDDNNHGTHVAGTIGATGHNGVGSTGVNWTTRIMALKFLDASGSGSLSGAIDCIDFAIQAKSALGPGANVRVLSNSWGGSGYSQSLASAINRSAAANMLFVAAAGNSASNQEFNPQYPGAYNLPNLVSVAATDHRDLLASFSNYGAIRTHLAAPGVSVLSTTVNGNYAFYSGTSMATPHVSGAAMLVLSACSSLNTTALRAAILNNVDVLPNLVGKMSSGGRLNVLRALQSCGAAASQSNPYTVGGPSTVAPGGTLSVSWTAADSLATDYIGLYTPGAANAAFVTRVFATGGTSGSLTLTAPSTTGSYELRYVFANGLDAARSSLIGVEVAVPIPTPIPTPIPPPVNTPVNTPINGIVAIATSPTTMRVLWNTVAPSDTYFQYGTTASYGLWSPYISTKTPTHTMVAIDLISDTTYNFRIVSMTAAGVVTYSPNQTIYIPPQGAIPNFVTTPNKFSGTAGSSLAITWLAPAAGLFSTDAIAISLVGSGVYSSVASFKTGGAASGTNTSLTLPTVPGTYELRYLLSIYGWIVARSAPIVVTAAP